MSSILITSEFSTVGVKKPLAVLAARLGPLGHGPEFGGFLYSGKPVWLPLNEKMVGPFPPPDRVFLLSCDGLRIKPSMVFYRLLCYIALT